MQANAQAGLDECPRYMPALELALLRRGVEHRVAARECCERCRRTPLVGERIYRGEAGSVLCALCRPEGPKPN